MSHLFEELTERGFVYQMTAPDEIKNRLNNDSLRFYVGFDPTGDSLHIGHLLPVMAMRRLQAAGHHPLVLVGGATGLVGDPSGKSEARPILTREKVASNAEALRKQLLRFISADNATFVNNADWFSDMLYLDFLRDIGSKFSVNKMLTAESVRMRLETGLSFLEFNYMILQAYDFHILHQKYECKMQLGGQDQWGNITCGTELVRRIDHDEVYGMTLPLLMSSNGKKFGKSVSGAVYLDANKTSIFDYYQFWRNTEDNDVKRLMLLFTMLPTDEVIRLCDTETNNINRAKEILAYEATALAHGHDEAARAFAAAGSKFGFADADNKIPTSSRIREISTSSTDNPALADLPTVELEIPAEGIRFVQVLALSGLCKSISEARRLVQGGGAYFNEQRISDFEYVVHPSDFPEKSAILKAGKKNVRRVVVR